MIFFSVYIKNKKYSNIANTSKRIKKAMVVATDEPNKEFFASLIKDNEKYLRDKAHEQATSSSSILKIISTFN